MQVLLLIPKNLVYVFILIILFAFAAMSYITYTEQDLGDFVAYNRTREVVVVDPVYQKLQELMVSDEEDVESVHRNDFTMKMFVDDFVTMVRPLVIRDYADAWDATHKWSDKEYLKKKAGQ